MEDAQETPVRKRRPILKLALGALVLMVAVIGVLAARQPDTFEVSRSISIDAPPETVFANVNDLHRWEHWSPWVKLDPEMKSTYSGEPAGEGASYAWSGDSQVGEGRMTIVKSEPHRQVGIKLEFVRPFAGENDVLLTLRPEGSQTVTTWAMSGKNSSFSKVIGLFLSMDQMIGGMFEKGLADLKTLSESDAAR